MYNNMIPFGHNRLFDLFDSFDQELLPTMTGLTALTRNFCRP